MTRVDASVEINQKTYPLSVQVTDQDGEALAGATVKITSDPAGAYGETLTTGSDGWVSYEKLPGTYYVQVSGTTFQTIEYEVNHAPSESTFGVREGNYR
jgi:hypothetical protein